MFDSKDFFFPCREIFMLVVVEVKKKVHVVVLRVKNWHVPICRGAERAFSEGSWDSLRPW